jgi:acyl carrier protein
LLAQPWDGSLTPGIEAQAEDPAGPAVHSGGGLEVTTNAEEIRTRIKQIIANVAGLNAGRINDEARLRDDLKLDSLSLLEIGVDVDLAFKLELPDERYKEVDSLPAMVSLVQQRLGERMESARAVQG